MLVIDRSPTGWSERSKTGTTGPIVAQEAMTPIPDLWFADVRGYLACVLLFLASCDDAVFLCFQEPVLDADLRPAAARSRLPVAPTQCK